MSDGGVPEEGVLLPMRKGQEIAAMLFSGAFLGFVAWAWIDILAGGGRWRQPSSVVEVSLFALLGLGAGMIALWALIGGIWRLRDGGDLLRFDAEGLHCHPSIGPRLVRWSEMSGSRHGVMRGKTGPLPYVEIDLTRPFPTWYMPLAGKRLRIGFSGRSDLAREAAKIVRARRLAAGWKR